MFINDQLTLVAAVWSERVAESDLGDTIVESEYGENSVLGRIVPHVIVYVAD